MNTSTPSYAFMACTRGNFYINAGMTLCYSGRYGRSNAIPPLFLNFASDTSLRMSKISDRRWNWMDLICCWSMLMAVFNGGYTHVIKKQTELPLDSRRQMVQKRTHRKLIVCLKRRQIFTSRHGAKSQMLQCSATLLRHPKTSHNYVPMCRHQNGAHLSYGGVTARPQ
jgi:hypothetical protein